MKIDEVRASASAARIEALAKLRERLETHAAAEDRLRAGFELERILHDLFTLSNLAPREPFRVVGEQIDGAFELDHEVYLLEAKWEREPLSEAPLLVFRGKIEGKSTFTRGVLIAMNDVSKEALDALTRGKQPTFFIVTGYDLMMVLQGVLPLDEFLRRRFRLLAERGTVRAPFDASRDR